MSANSRGGGGGKQSGEAERLLRLAVAPPGAAHQWLAAQGQMRGLVRQLSIDQFENESRRVSMGVSASEPGSVARKTPLFQRSFSEPVSVVFHACGFSWVWGWGVCIRGAKVQDGAGAAGEGRMGQGAGGGECGGGRGGWAGEGRDPGVSVDEACCGRAWALNVLMPGQAGAVGYATGSCSHITPASPSPNPACVPARKCTHAVFLRRAPPA